MPPLTSARSASHPLGKPSSTLDLRAVGNEREAPHTSRQRRLPPDPSTRSAGRSRRRRVVVNRGASGPVPYGRGFAARCGPGCRHSSGHAEHALGLTDHLVGEAPLVVVPGHHLAQGAVHDLGQLGTASSACPTPAACCAGTSKSMPPRSSCVCSSSWPASASSTPPRRPERTLPTGSRTRSPPPPEPAKEPPNECDRYGGTNANADLTRQARSAATPGYQPKPARSRLRLR